MKNIIAAVVLIVLIQVALWRLPLPKPPANTNFSPTIEVKVTPASLDIITLTVNVECQISGHTKKMTDLRTGKVTFSDVRVTGNNCVLAAHDIR